MTFKLFRILAVVTGLVMIGKVALDEAGVRINYSPSMPLGVYVLHPGRFPTHPGEMVFACPMGDVLHYLQTYHPEMLSGGPDCPDGTQAIIKTAIGLPGDVVRLTSEGVSVNGSAVLAGSRPLLRAGTTKLDAHDMPQYARGDHTISNGTAWVYTPEWFSFDSRYYGAIAIAGTADPILVYRQAEPDSELPANVATLQH